MATHTFTIPLGDGQTKISDYYSGSNSDTTYVTLTDNGNLSNVFLTKFGHSSATESGEGPGGDDEVYVDLSGFDDDFSIDVKSMDAGDTFYFTKAIVTGPNAYTNVGDVYTINYIGSDGFMHTLTIDLESCNHTGSASIVITCFAKGTLIETYHGPCAVEDLELGDLVLCGDGHHRQIQWVSSRHIHKAEMQAHPEFRPIRIRKGGLGHNRPDRDLLVSPHHRVLVKNWRSEFLFGEKELLVAAKFLDNDRSIEVDTMIEEVTYYHFMFDSHQTVWSNGVETESFHPGDMAVQGISDGSREELYSLFPGLEQNPESFGPTCRPTLKGFEAKALFSEELA